MEYAASHRVVCVERGTVPRAPDHTHVVALHTTEADGETERWSVVSFVTAVRAGERFHTASATSGLSSSVLPFVCPLCGTVTIRSASDAAPDSHVENLPQCGADEHTRSG
ncbi:MAG: hypothetical protein ACRDGV_06560 [Candidatus Limnocylindria bacterium]